MQDQTPRAREGETVLLVDDDDQVRRALGLLLENLGYITHIAQNAQEALDQLDQIGDEVHLVISDVVMPGIDGVQLAHEIRQRFPELPILLISGYSDGSITGVGVSRFLRKPFSMQQLAKEVRTTLAGE